MSETPFLGTTITGQVRVVFGPFSFSPAEAREVAVALQRAGQDAENLPSTHERHTNLLASCPLCVHEANGQMDRLTFEEEDPS